MLLSDGHANGGDTDPQHLAQRAADAFQDGVQTRAPSAWGPTSTRP